MNSLALLLTLAAVTGKLPPPEDRVNGVVLVSLYSLIANPEIYTESPLRLGGYWLTGHEMSLLCPQPVSASPLDCVELGFAQDAKKPAARLAGRAVTVDGRFTPSSGENWSIYSGRIIATEIRPALELKDESSRSSGKEP